MTRFPTRARIKGPGTPPSKVHIVVAPVATNGSCARRASNLSSTAPGSGSRSLAEGSRRSSSHPGGCAGAGGVDPTHPVNTTAPARMTTAKLEFAMASSRGVLGLEQLSRETHEVGLSDDADQLAVLDHRETADLAVFDRAGGIGGEGVGTDGDDVGLHQHVDGDLARDRARTLVGGIAVTDPRGEQLSVGDETDEALLGVDNGQVADASGLHEVPRQIQAVPHLEELDRARHDVSNEGGLHGSYPLLLQPSFQPLPT